MSDRVRPDLGLDQWLADQHNALVHDLAETLNLQAGIRDALLPAPHARLVEELGDTLDLQAGLADAKSRVLEANPELETDTVSSPHDINQVEIMPSAWLDVGDRLDVRTHTASPSFRTCSCVRIRIAVLNATYANTQKLRELVDADRDSSRTARSLLDKLIEAVGRTREKFERGFDEDLNHFRDLAHKIVRALSTDSALSQAHAMAQMVAEKLDEIERYLNDFTDADLENVDLQPIRLAGLRWSNRTKWPSDWIDLIRRDSMEIAPGIFIIRGNDPLTR